MLFIHTWQKVLDGTKTLTSRRAYPNDNSDDLFYPCRYEVGKTYAVQKDYKHKAMARILVTDVWLAKHSREISEDDARAEGFENAQEFIETYATIYGQASLDRPCWRIRFFLVPPGKDGVG